MFKCSFWFRPLMRSAVLVFSFTLFLLSSSSIWACSCLAKEPSEYLAQCEQLFIATLDEVKLELKDGPITKVKGKFSSPSHIIKGDPSAVKGIINTRTGTSCDAYLQVGEEYVVCGKGEGFVENSMCGYTHSLFGDAKLKLMEQLSGEVAKNTQKKQLVKSSAGAHSP